MAPRDRLALWYAILIWLAGFAWGSIVFSVPALDDAPGLRGVSSNLAISLPILIAWVPLSWWLARRWLARAPAVENRGVRLGLWFAATNFVLDLVVLVLLFGSGLDYFAAATVWLGYAVVFAIPILAGRYSGRDRRANSRPAPPGARAAR